MNSDLFLQTLCALRPEGFRVEGNNGYEYVTLWEGDDPIPTEDEFNAKYAELAPAFYMNALRVERDKRIAETDWWVLPDRTPTDEQLAYRQALRDLPDNTEDPANPVWPTKPE